MKTSLALALMLAATLYAVPTLGQEITGNLEGRILDETGEPIPFVTITVSSPSLQGTRSVMSTSDGYFGVFKLPVGTYSVEFAHVSFQEVRYEDIMVRLGRTTTMGELKLSYRVYEVPEVVVTEKRTLLDVTTTTVGANLAREDFEVLPIERDYRNIPALLPQVDENFFGDGINFVGGTGFENRYFVDGVDVTDPHQSRTGIDLPYNFMREVEVRTGSYEAEYRSSLGGVVNVITNSGGNEFHGQVFGFFTSDRFTQDPKQGVYEPPATEFSEYDVGFSLGGPVSRDKLWFFAAYNPTVEQRDVETPGFGFQKDENIAHVFSGKLTWKAAEKFNVAFSVFGDPAFRDAVDEVGPGDSLANLDPVLRERRSGGTALSLYGNYLMNDRTLFEVAVSRNDRAHRNEPATERGRSDSLFIDEVNGIWSGGSAGTFETLSSRTSIETKGTVILGNHKFKVGLEYREISADVYDLWHTVEQSGDSLYKTHYNLVDGTVGSRIPSAFIQDSWQAHRRWRINAGVRWDGQFMLDSNGDVAQKITDQFQPRVGFVYQPGEIGTQKIFGSFGRFYQDIGTHLSTTYHIEGITWQDIKYDHDPRFDSSGGDTLYSMSSSIHPEVDDLEGQHYDEFTLGYERQIGNLWKFGATGVYRTLQQGVEDAFVAAVGDFRYGNPGKGLLSEFPEMKREYTGLVLTAERSGGEHLNFLASYVLSRTEGNYSGLFNQDFGWGQPNWNGDFDILEMTENFDGLLANDRTHKLKFLGSYRTNFGLIMGSSFMWQSGTPRSICEGSSWGDPYWAFVEERGSAGRTPSIWDLNIRFAYDLPSLARATVHPRLLLDVFHLGSRREAVQFDQIRSFLPDGQEPNPTFGLATQYQPPTAVRLGMEVSF